MAKFKEDSIDPSFPVAPPSGKPCPASKMIVWFVTGSEFTSIVVGEIDVEKIEINIENDIKRILFLFKQYDYDDNIKTVFSSDTKVYLIQQGVYSSLESMKENMIGFNYYIYSYENDKYYTYIAITKSLENLEKLKGYYKSLGYSIYVKEIDINSSDYINILDQYDNLLSTTDKKETIDAIMMQVLSKYEEMNMND